MIATTPTNHNTCAIHNPPARPQPRPGGPTITLTRGERAHLRAVQGRPAADFDDVIMLQNGRLVALLGRPRIAVRLARANLTMTVVPDLDDPSRPGSVHLTPAGWLAMETGRY